MIEALPNAKAFFVHDRFSHKLKLLKRLYFFQVKSRIGMVRYGAGSRSAASGKTKSETAAIVFQLRFAIWTASKSNIARWAIQVPTQNVPQKDATGNEI